MLKKKIIYTINKIKIKVNRKIYYYKKIYFNVPDCHN